ncbi:MAG: MJ0144 family RNA dihydrouridine synthase-like protein [Archaeoglobaceae archaeon]
MRFENRVALSAMAGINDAEFCNRQRAALVVLGGFNADKKAMEAAKKAVRRGRKEFVFEDPIAGIEEELKKLRKKTFAVNVRSSTLEGYLAVAELVADYGGILEINAHCRQPEFVEIGCGEALMFDPERLVEVVRAAAKLVPVSVKIRGGYGIDYESLSFKVFAAGAKFLHVDAMIPGGGCDLELITRLSKLGNVIGNNSFVDAKSGEAIIKAGAKLASAARAVLKDERFFEKVLAESPLLSQPIEV